MRQKDKASSSHLKWQRKSGASMHGNTSRLALAMLVSLVALLLAAYQADAHMIELQPSEEECFFEDLNPGDQVRVESEADWKDECVLNHHLLILHTHTDDTHISSRWRRAPRY